MVGGWWFGVGWMVGGWSLPFSSDWNHLCVLATARCIAENGVAIWYHLCFLATARCCYRPFGKEEMHQQNLVHLRMHACWRHFGVFPCLHGGTGGIILGMPGGRGTWWVASQYGVCFNHQPPNSVARDGTLQMQQQCDQLPAGMLRPHPGRVQTLVCGML